MMKLASVDFKVNEFCKQIEIFLLLNCCLILMLVKLAQKNCIIPFNFLLYKKWIVDKLINNIIIIK